MFDTPRSSVIKSSSLTAPPLSSGLGRGPLKAKTRVRVPLGALFFKYISRPHPEGVRAPLRGVNNTGSHHEVVISPVVSKGMLRDPLRGGFAPFTGGYAPGHVMSG